MKKSYLFLLGLVAFGVSATAQTKVIFRVDMRNEAVSANGVHIPGDYQTSAGMASNWVPGDAACEAKDPDNDKVFELQVTLAPGTYQYKFINNNDWAAGGENVPTGCRAAGSDNRELVVGTSDMILNVVCFSSCSVCADVTFERNVTFMVVDSNSKFSDVKFKGTMSGWADFQAYDDGTNGDKTANDFIFTAVYKTKNAAHEWGATNKGNWIIQGPNKTFNMTLDGKITGDTSYPVPKLGALIDVTFNVDMSNEIVAQSGVFVSGNFMEALASSIGNWDKDTLKLQPRTTGSDIYTLTVKLHAGKYDWKFWNGVDKVNPDAPGENGDFTAGGCGGPNGIGGHNRIIDFKGLTTAQVLKTYLFNSCNLSASINKIGGLKFGIAPNPAQNNATITFKNNGSVQAISITDLTGREVLSQNVNSSTVEINLEGLAKGVYTITAFGTDGAYGVQKLVKN